MPQQLDQTGVMSSMADTGTSPTQAVQTYRILGRLGSPRSREQVFFGTMYEFGKGVEQIYRS